MSRRKELYKCILLKSVLPTTIPFAIIYAALSEIMNGQEHIAQVSIAVLVFALIYAVRGYIKWSPLYTDRNH